MCYTKYRNMNNTKVNSVRMRKCGFACVESVSRKCSLANYYYCINMLWEFAIGALIRKWLAVSAALCNCTNTVVKSTSLYYSGQIIMHAYMQTTVLR